MKSRIASRNRSAGPQPFGDDGLRGGPASKVAGNRGEEDIPLEGEQPDVGQGPYRGGSGHVPKQGDLAERRAWALPAGDLVVDMDFDVAAVDHVEPGAPPALADDPPPRPPPPRDEAGREAPAGPRPG